MPGGAWCRSGWEVCTPSKSTPGKLKMEGLELLRMFAALHLTLPPFSQALSCFACALSEFCRGSVCQVSPLEAPDLALSAPGLRSTPLRSVPLRPSALRASSSAPEGLIHRLRLAKLGKGFGKTGKGLPKAAPGPNSACKIHKSSYAPIRRRGAVPKNLNDVTLADLATCPR